MNGLADIRFTNLFQFYPCESVFIRGSNLSWPKRTMMNGAGFRGTPQS
jgi:hypothetical protein